MSFAKTEVNYHGHQVSKRGISTDPSNLAKVLNWPTPKTIKEVKAFLGIASYYQRFIDNFAHVASPLNKPTRKERGEKTNTSDFVVGAILSQVQNGAERPLAYASRRLNSAETNYPAIEKEALVIVWDIAHFRPYLYGRSFLVITDHQPLTFLQSLKEPKGRLASWVNELSQYDFKVHYKSGVEHTDADALSQRPHSCQDTKQPASLCHPDNVVCQNISIAPSYTNEELANLQRQDPVLRRVIDKLVTSNVCPPPSGPWRSGALRRYRQIWSQLVIQDGVLCRLCSRDRDRSQLQLKYFNFCRPRRVTTTS